MTNVSEKKYLVTGASGLLGQIMVPYLAGLGHEVYALVNHHSVLQTDNNIRQVKCDLTDTGSLKHNLEEIFPDVIIHAAGLTSVDQCETDPALAFLLNRDVPTFIAEWCAHNGRRYVFISSDHVTGGIKPCFSEDDTVAPMNVYAQTKAQAEQNVLSACPDALVIRTNFFGRGPSWRKSLTDWLWDKASSSEKIPAFTDSYFSPISTYELTKAISDLVLSEECGLFHIGGSERLSKYEFALAFADFFDFDRNLVQPSTTADARLIAPRPLDMSMSVEKIERALNRPMPTISQSLHTIRQDYLSLSGNSIDPLSQLQR